MAAKQINSREIAKLKHAPEAFIRFITKGFLPSISFQGKRVLSFPAKPTATQTFSSTFLFSLTAGAAAGVAAGAGAPNTLPPPSALGAPNPVPPPPNGELAGADAPAPNALVAAAAPTQEKTSRCGGFRRWAGGQACDAFRENEPERSDSNQPECTSALFCCAHESVATAKKNTTPLVVCDFGPLFEANLVIGQPIRAVGTNKENARAPRPLTSFRCDTHCGTHRSRWGPPDRRAAAAAAAAAAVRTPSPRHRRTRRPGRRPAALAGRKEKGEAKGCE